MFGDILFANNVLADAGFPNTTAWTDKDKPSTTWTDKDKAVNP